MNLKEIIRSQICGIGRPSISTFRSFTRWADSMDRRQLRRLLDEIQIDLDEEELHFREISALLGKDLLHHQLRQQWSMYCGQLRDYYRSTIDDSGDS